MNSFPVSYQEVGRAAQDLLTRDFFTRGVKVEAKCNTSNGGVFQLEGIRDNDTQSIQGDIKAKHQYKDQGLTITESCGTSKIMSAEIELADTITKGLKFRLAAKLNSPKNKQATVFGYELRKGMIAHKAEIDFGSLMNKQGAGTSAISPEISATASATKGGVTVGAETIFRGGVLSHYNFVAGYRSSDHVLALHATDKLSALALSYHQRVRPGVEVAARTSIVTKNGISGDVLVEAVGKIALDGDAFIKAKMDSIGRISLMYSQLMRPGVRMAASCAIDTTRIQEAVHKTGLVLSFEA